MDIPVNILAKIREWQAQDDDDLLLALWPLADDGVLRAHPLSKLERAKRARAWLDNQLSMHIAAICALPVVVRYCRGEELTEAAIAALAETFAAHYGIDHGIAIAVIAVRRGLRRLCSVPDAADRT